MLSPELFNIGKAIRKLTDDQPNATIVYKNSIAV